ncbi:MAG: hypothetical protein GY855_14510, partial [candidate division Zixibacteria bacterium]|nr:hypothetical protein [candidate division Zixibacteria bacterium]
MSIRIKTVLSIALLLSICIPQVSFGQENMSFEITSYGNLDGYDGYFQEMRFDGELHETDFLFEENGYIRWYAYKMSWQDEFQNLPEGIYVVKSENLWIGEQWNSWWDGEVTTVTVFDTTTIILRETDTLFTFIAVNQNQYGDIVSIEWWSDILGRVWMVHGEDLGILYSWTILGGYGYYPLFVGNRWEYRSMYENNVLDISIDSTTYIFGDTHHVANMSWDSYYSETNYFKTINDTLYCKGVAFPGEPPQQANYIMTPQYPTLGSEWYSFWI